VAQKAPVPPETVCGRVRARPPACQPAKLAASAWQHQARSAKTRPNLCGSSNWSDIEESPGALEAELADFWGLSVGAARAGAWAAELEEEEEEAPAEEERK